MRNILKIASLLDYSGQYNLSDKLFKIAQEQTPSLSQTQQQNSIISNSNNPESFIKNLTDFAKQNGLSTIGDAMDEYADAGANYNGKPINQNFILKKFFIQYGTTDINLPQHIEILTEEFKTAQENQQQNKSEQGNVENYSSDAGKNNFFNDQMQADQISYQRFMMMNTNTPENFVKSLFEFSKQNNINNLVQAFDAYANAGASYNGNLIKNVPFLRELYMRVRNTPRMIPQQELAQELTMLTTPQKTTLNLQGKESQDLGTYWYQAVMREPLDGLETFKTEVQKDQELNESQKTNLIKIIDQRIMNRR